MPVLNNPKHEMYAQRLATGEKEVSAYAAVGYKPDDGNASKLARKVRVQEITGKAAVVLLESPGGSALAGIEIGRTIRLRNFLTWVPSGVRCASACAAAWLGGTKRLMGKSALVGFHAAYRVDQGRIAESAAANAVLALQLPLFFEVSALSGGLVSPTPE
jgi:hypothetical protein